MRREARRRRRRLLRPGRPARCPQRPSSTRTVVACTPSLGAMREELLAVGAGVGRDAAQPAFVEEIPLVVQRRDVGDPDAGRGDRPTTIERAKRDRHELPRRREHDRTVERLRRLVHRLPDRVAAQLDRQPPVVLAAGQHVHAQALGQGHLRRQVGRAAEPVDAQPSAGGHLRQPQRPVADDPRTQQRRGLVVIEPVRQHVREPLVDQAVLRVAAIDVPAGEGRSHAQVLPTGSAVAAGPVGATQPRHSDPLTDAKPFRSGADPVDDADNLVAGYRSRPARGEVAFGQVEVRSAHPAAGDPHPDLKRSRLGVRQIDEHERTGRDRSRPVDHPRPHARATSRGPAR